MTTETGKKGENNKPLEIFRRVCNTPSTSARRTWSWTCRSVVSFLGCSDPGQLGGDSGKFFSKHWQDEYAEQRTAGLSNPTNLKPSSRPPNSQSSNWALSHRDVQWQRRYTLSTPSLHRKQTIRVSSTRSRVETKKKEYLHTSTSNTPLHD